MANVALEGEIESLTKQEAERPLPPTWADMLVAPTGGELQHATNEIPPELSIWVRSIFKGSFQFPAT